MIGTELDQQAAVILLNVIRLAEFYTRDLGHVTGGSLHIVLSDGNLRRSDLEFCLTWATEKKDYVGVALAQCLMDLDLSQLQSVYEVFRGKV